MKQQSLGLGQSSKRTRRREFLSEMERVVPWSALVALVAPYMPEGRRGRPPFAVEAMLRIHFMQQWFKLSDPAMEDALHDVPLFREFAGLAGWDDRLPDESTILRFRHVLDKHKLAGQILQTVNDLLTAKGLLLRQGTVVD
ncbi:transposase, partial [Sphaerotilus sp.]|uniref:transposase n=1 Tax=Sphaerotilus sp. TaxID=2093942 RepID=UPI0034E29EED